jgi:hypothetical protein
LPWFLAAMLLLGAAAHAQLSVTLQIKRRLFMIHEPILATVVVGNQTGRDVMLADTAEGGPWFSFQINSTEGRAVAPRDLNYEVEPLQIKAGETLKRTVNLNALFPLNEFGSYRVKASVYFPEFGKYFGSKLDHFAVMEGKSIMKQVVGSPDGGYRTVSVLSMEHDTGKMIYARVEGLDDGIVYGCYNLGRVVEGIVPDIKFDSGNNLAVLQLIGPKTFCLSRIGVNGNFIGQSTYITPKSQPYLRKGPDGALQIVGAIRQEQKVAQTEPLLVPKVSDRPPGF